MSGSFDELVKYAGRLEEENARLRRGLEEVRNVGDRPAVHVAEETLGLRPTAGEWGESPA